MDFSLDNVGFWPEMPRQNGFRLVLYILGRYDSGRLWGVAYRTQPVFGSFVNIISVSA